MTRKTQLGKRCADLRGDFSVVLCERESNLLQRNFAYLFGFSVRGGPLFTAAFLK